MGGAPATPYHTPGATWETAIDLDRVHMSPMRAHEAVVQLLGRFQPSFYINLEPTSNIMQSSPLQPWIQAIRQHLARTAVQAKQQSKALVTTIAENCHTLFRVVDHEGAPARSASG
jgi:hypothetical protein